jgi:7-carboxy-7-deazaguanine synthase
MLIYKLMKINEIFYSLQGEGKWTGLPNIFIRTSGCNLRCSFCDTKYAYKDGKEISINKILKQIGKYNCKYICITGGEPLLQNETVDLIDALLKRKYKICLETNGTISVKKLSNKKSLMISLDIKCPSSNMHDKTYLKNISYLRTDDQLKFIIKDKNDFNYAKKIINMYKPDCTVFFQPVWGTNPRNLADWIVYDKLNVKLGLQLHKIIWGDSEGF